MDPLIIDPYGIEKIIDSLKPCSSPGVDLINTKILKGAKTYCSILLSKIFQQTTDCGILPADWTTGKVVPIHKSGSKTSPLNYRPISLTSIPCKVLEHIIYSGIANFLETNSFFTNTQHGFRKGLSCETQLASFTHKLHVILDRRSTIDCVFLDFAKAFEKVCHKLLLLKLSKLNLGSNLFSWLEYFLCKRSQFVTANNTTSSQSPVHSGVPQGSVLGPLLFLIYINDLPSCVSSNIHLFADDCVIFREINDNNDVCILQKDLTSVSEWCNSWLMQLNSSKCKVLRVSRTSSCFPGTYFLNSTLLEQVESYRYLGIHITSSLTWSLHISTIIKSANSMLGYLRRNFSTAPSSLKLTLYKTLVRSKLEYASAIWDPCSANLINALELTQNNAARFILTNYNRTASVTTMKNMLNLSNLASRRKVSRLCLFHKIFYHCPNLRDEIISLPSFISPRLDHSHKVGVPSFQTKFCSQSFIPRTSVDWNHLPGPSAGIEDNACFRNNVANIVYQG